jgi:hypothetical protein
VSTWTNLIGYQLVWFTTVIGAGHGLSWPALAALGVYATWQLGRSRERKTDAALMATAILLGLILDGGLLHFGLTEYRPAWPLATMAPAWILTLWAAFALTFTQSLFWLQKRVLLAALLGAIGGPLAYLGASRGWHVATFAEPLWRALLWLAIGWGLATSLLAWLAGRYSRALTRTSAAPA